MNVTNRLYLVLSFVACFFFIGLESVRSQADGARRVYNEQLRTAFDRGEEVPREDEFTAGGWFNFDFIHYNDPFTRRRRSLRRHQLRGWFKMDLGGVHTAYVRGLLRYDDWDGRDNPSGGRGDDFDEILERAWYKLDVGKLLAGDAGDDDPFGMTFKVGRDYTSLGTALVLSRPMDQIRFDISAYDFRFTALLGKSVRDGMNTVDASPLVYNRNERCFYGFQIEYDNHGYHRPFAYFLSSDDHTSPSSIDPAQQYDYSPKYLGIGSRGMLIPDLTYRAELVGEWGSTFSESNLVFTRRGPVFQNHRDRICAMAANLQMEYLFRVPTEPRVSVEYLYASGDPDRRTSSSATVGGNLMGTRDRAFNAFGFRDTGIAFAPFLSNIHIYTAGLRFFPLEHYDLFKKLEVGTKVFFYHKDRAGGPISDPTVIRDSRWLGWEWDVYFNWRITSDLAVTTRYGMFRPGAAVGERFDATRHFFYTGMILSF